MKCWHCGHNSRNTSDAYIKFAYKERWIQKRIWLCPYCYGNLRRQISKALSPIIKKKVNDLEANKIKKKGDDEL